MSALSLADALVRDAAGLLLIKVTFVLALASSVAAAAKGFSAARRHTLWLAALLSCVCLALWSPVLPAIMIQAPVLVRRADVAKGPSTIAVPPSSRAAAIDASHVSDRENNNSEAVRREPVRSMPLPTHPLLALWLVGCVALLARDAIAWVGATRLARRAVGASDAGADPGHAGQSHTIGPRRQIALAYSGEVKSPIAFGLVRPVVLLPREARSWPAARVRAALDHEVAHVSRHDCVSQTIGRLACALFWFHPLAWYAFAHLRAEAERAADDCVLRSGMPALEYASHLLELARRVSHGTGVTNARVGAVTVGMMMQTDLERRFRSMFDQTRSRATIAPRARAATIGFALVMSGPVASLRVGTTAGRSHAKPTAAAHPDFSGTWSSDTTWIQTLQFAWVVTDSLKIMQTANAISLDSRGHIMGALTRMLSRTHDVASKITFDGAPCPGVTVTGNSPLKYNVEATWAGDTLVLRSHAGSGGQGVYTISRMSLSADGQTLFDTNQSFDGGKDRWGVRTSTLHRRSK